MESDSKDCAEVELRELGEGEREEFILENQWAFKYGAVGEFGVRDEHYEEDGEVEGLPLWRAGHIILSLVAKTLLA